MSKLTQKLTSLLLTVTLLISFTPANVFAQNSPYEVREEVSIESTVSYDAGEEHDFSGEVISKDEYSTVFLNEDGSYTALMYSSAIRYEDENGVLSDIDTSLVKKEGLREDVNMSESPEESVFYESANTPVKTYLPETLSEGSYLKTVYKGYEISLLPITKDSASFVTEEGSSLLSEELSFEYASAASGVAGELTQNVSDLYGQSEDKLTSLSYNAFGAESSVSLNYSALPFGLKEELIINRYTGVNSFDFAFKTSGAYAVLSEHGAIILYDNETNEEIGALCAPYAYDASGAAEYEVVSYDLREISEGNYIITLSADEAYLKDEERAYPVTLDPTVTYRGSSEIYDSYVKSYYPNTNFYTSSTMLIPVGYGGEGFSRTYIKIPSVSSLSGKLVSSAYFYGMEEGNGSPYANVEIRRVLNDWSPYSVTWNTQPSYSSSVECTTAFNGSESSFKRWNVTSLVSKWASGEYENHGFVFKASTESTSVRNYGDIYGSRTGASNLRPYLAVNYVDAPTILSHTETSGGVNTGYSNITLAFQGISASGNYYLKISNEAGNSIVRDISSEASLISSRMYWTSSQKSVFAGYTGFPDSAAVVLGGSSSKYRLSVGAGNSAGVKVFGEEVEINLSDNTSPGTVPSVNYETSEDENHPGSSKVTVSFAGASDLPAENPSGMAKYVLKLYQNDVFIEGSEREVPHSGSESYSYTYENLSAQNNVRVTVTSYDQNGNYSAEVTTSTFNLSDREGPSAAESIAVTPSGWTSSTEVGVSWSGITDNVDPSSQLSVYYKVEKQTSAGYVAVLSERGLGSGEEGSANINLSELSGDGVYRIAVYAKDSLGNIGGSAYGFYYKDTTTPLITVNSPSDNSSISGMLELSAAINDANLSEWRVEYKKNTLLSSYQTLAQGQTSVNGSIVSFDTSSLEDGSEYKFRISAQDAAGNSSELVLTYVKVSLGHTVANVFEIEKELVSNKWLLQSTANVINVVPTGDESLPSGNRALLADGVYIGSFAENENISLNIADPEKYPEGSSHHAVVRITNANGEIFYSSPVIETNVLAYSLSSESEGFSKDENVLLSQGAYLSGESSENTGSIISEEKTINGSLASFTLNASSNKPAGSEVRYYASVNGSEYFETEANREILNEEILCGADLYANSNTIRIKVVLEKNSNGETPFLNYVSLDVVQYGADEGGMFEVELISPPSLLTATPKINYTTLLRWNASENANVSYNVYKAEVTEGGSAAFGEMTLIKSGISDNYWNDYSLDYGKNFVYAVTAVKEVGGYLRESKPSNISNPAQVVSENELKKHLGLEEHWEYESFSDSYGVGYGELYEGNFVYMAVDSQINGASLAMVMRRSYNSHSENVASFGKGWDFSFNTALLREYKRDEVSGELTERAMLLKDGDGSIHRFELTEEGYTAEAGSDIKLFCENGLYRAERTDGIKYVFNESNRIAEMNTKAGDKLIFTYDPQRGNLIKVTNTSGESMSFSYANDLITKLTLPNGHEINYTYDSKVRLISKSESVSDYEISTESFSAGIAQTQSYGYNTGGRINKITTPSGTSSTATVNISYTDDGKLSSVLLPENMSLSFEYLAKDVLGNTGARVSLKIAATVFAEMSSVLNQRGAAIRKTSSDGTVYNITRDENLNITQTSFENTFYKVNENGSVTSEKRNVSYSYAYNANGDIQSVTDPQWNVTSYAYQDENNPHSITSVSFPKGENETGTVTSTYDASTGNLLSETDPVGGVTSYGYGRTDENGEVKDKFLLTSVTDRYGTQTSYNYTSDLRISSQSLRNNANELITERAISYDASGNPEVLKDAKGSYVKYVYDEKNRVVSAIDLGSTLIAEGKPRAYVSYYPSGEVKRHTDANGNYVNYTYDALNRVVSEKVNEENKTTPIRTTTYAYSYENVTIGGEEVYAFKVVKTVSSQQGSSFSSTAYYDSSYRLIKEISLGTHSEITYDEAGNIKSVKTKDGREIAYVYDELMRKTAVVINPESDRIVNSFTYDKQGNMLSQTDGEGYTKTYTYDLLNRLTSVTEGGNTTTYTYASQAENDLITSVKTNPKGLRSVSVYDRAGRLAEQRDEGEENGQTLSIATSYAYDPSSNVIGITKQDGSKTEHTYDSLNHVVQTVYKRDANGSPISYTNYTYDNAGNLMTMKDYEGTSSSDIKLTTQTSYAYDALYRVIQQNQDGEVVNYSYNAKSDVAEISYRDAAEVGSDEDGTVEVAYAYNEDGQLEQVYRPGEESIVGVFYLYDENGFLTQRLMRPNFQDNFVNDEARYEYNTLGNISKITYSTSNGEGEYSEEQSYTYDKRGYIVSEENVITIGEEGTETYQQSISTKDYTYDSVGRLVQVEASSAEDNTSATYSYDSAGNRTGMIKDGTSTSYSFNILNQLISSGSQVTLSDSARALTHSYTYNANGDLISDTEVRPLEDFTEELQQYPEYYISGSLTKTTDRSYSYDSAGRLTDTENVSTIEGTITKLKDQYGNVVQNLNQELDPTLYKFTEGAYTYNGAGQRVKKEVIMYNENGEALPTVTRKYYYTGDCVLFVADASNNKTIENVHDPSGNILLSQRFELTSNGNFENGWYLFNTDIRGSITSILREDLSFATGYVYDEYGNQIKTGEKDFLNEATYTGAIYDEESDLYFLNARYYDSNTGQFISRDTYLGDAYRPWTQNLYSYTGGNPVNYIDPTGHSAIAGWLIWEVAKVLGEYALAGLAGYLTAKAVHKLVSTPRPKTTTSSPRVDPGGGTANRTAGGGFSLPQRSAGDYVESFPWGADTGYGGTIIDPIPTAQELSDYVERFPWEQVIDLNVYLEKTPKSDPNSFIKLKGNQGYIDKKGNVWKKDMLHGDHWDISNKKGIKIREIRFDGTQLWPNGPKNKNK